MSPSSSRASLADDHNITMHAFLMKLYARLIIKPNTQPMMHFTGPEKDYQATKAVATLSAVRSRITCPDFGSSSESQFFTTVYSFASTDPRTETLSFEHLPICQLIVKQAYLGAASCTSSKYAETALC